MHAQHVTSAEAAYRNVAAADLEAIAGLLEDARRIVVFAEASAQVPALLFVHSLRHALMHGDLVNSEVDAMIALHDIGPQDVVVFFALTLAFRATVTVHDFVRARGATTLAIVGSAGQPAATAREPTRSSRRPNRPRCASPLSPRSMRSSCCSLTSSAVAPGIVFAEQGTLLEIYQTTKLAAPLTGG